MSIKRQTLWSIAPLVVVTIVNVVSVPLFYRFLGAELYALWFYVLTFTGAFGFMDLGLGVAVGRYVGVALGKNDVQAVREYWGTGNAIALPLLAVMGLIFGIIGVIFGPKWFNIDPSLISLLRWSFVVGAAGLFVSYYGQFWLILSQAHLDFKFLSILRIGTSLLQILPSIAIAWATRNPFLLILWTTVVSVLQLIVFVAHSKKSYALGFDLAHSRWQRAREMALYTAKTFASLIVGAITSSADRLVLGRLAPAADFTNYAISANVGSRILGVSGAAMAPVFSNTNRAVGSDSREGVAFVYNETFNFTFPWYALAAIWTWLWHPAALRLWLGESVGGAVAPIFAPIITACCLTAISNISTAQLGSLNRVGTSLLFNLVAGIALVAGVIAGWNSYGIVGVAWAFLLSRFIVFIQDLYVIRLIKAGGWLDIETWKHLLLQMAAGLIFFGAGLFFVPRTSFWQLFFALAHGGAVSVWLLRKPAGNLWLRIRSETL